MTAQQFPCEQCGALLVFEPGTAFQKCEYCGHRNQIETRPLAIEELNYGEYVAKLRRVEGEPSQTPHHDERVLHCNTCGADISLGSHTTADACAYCGSNVVLKETKRVITPRSLLPFGIKAEAARDLFKRWLASRWFAPNDLKRKALAEGGLQGIYVPYWTFDSQTTSWYTGERGEDYYVTEQVTVMVNGKRETRMQQVRRTRWYRVSGTVSRFFDDVLVLGSKTLPRKYTEALEPWDLEALEPFNEKYLSGFRAEKYQVDLEPGFANAHQIMEGQIRYDVQVDIGGDHQRIHQLDIRHSGVTFKHILLPIWISAYRYHRKVYRFLVNGRSGEVQGERPYSVIKILLASISVASLVGLGVYLAKYFEG